MTRSERQSLRIFVHAKGARSANPQPSKKSTMRIPTVKTQAMSEQIFRSSRRGKRMNVSCSSRKAKKNERVNLYLRMSEEL